MSAKRYASISARPLPPKPPALRRNKPCLPLPGLYDPSQVIAQGLQHVGLLGPGAGGIVVHHGVRPPLGARQAR